MSNRRNRQQNKSTGLASGTQVKDEAEDINPADELRDPVAELSEQADQDQGEETVRRGGPLANDDEPWPAPVPLEPVAEVSAVVASTEVVLVTVTIPVLREAYDAKKHGYATARFDANLSGTMAERCRQTVVGMSTQHVTYRLNGRNQHVDACNDVVRWLFEQIDQQMVAAEAAAGGQS